MRDSLKLVLCNRRFPFTSSFSGLVNSIPGPIFIPNFSPSRCAPLNCFAFLVAFCYSVWFTIRRIMDGIHTTYPVSLIAASTLDFVRVWDPSKATATKRFGQASKRSPAQLLAAKDYASQLISPPSGGYSPAHTVTVCY